jgi:toxin YoeB
LSAKKKAKKSEDEQNRLVIIVQRRVLFNHDFRDDLQWWYRQEPIKANKILDLVEAVCISPFVGIGKPEPLKFVDAGTWSRRIDREHRLIY